MFKMNRIHLKTVKVLRHAQVKLDEIVQNRDLPALHRFTNDLQITLPLEVVHENRKILLDGFRVHKPEDIPEYAEKLKQRLEVLLGEYRQK